MQLKISLNRYRSTVYKAWKDRLRIYYFWFDIKNFRWSRNSVSLRGGRSIVYKAWKDRLRIYYFWFDIKNFRWSRNPVSLRGGLRSPQFCNDLNL